MKILVTGAAGFIGYHVTRALLARGDEVVGLDNLNDYYDVNLKYARLAQCGIRPESVSYGEWSHSELYPHYCFVKLALEDRAAIESLFATENFEVVCHLAAQAGVRYSLDHPHVYINSNLVGFINILEGCRQHGVKSLSYASSSSVYGLNEKQPFSTHHNVDHPVSLYAATKKANELMAHTYSYLYGLPVTGLRFFTVYGPWGRPDMAYFKFVKSILEDRPIEVFNHGEMARDFTYIDDIVDGLLRVIDQPATADPNWNALHPDPASSRAPYRIYNIGNNNPVKLIDFIAIIENVLGKKAEKIFKPLQPGDVVATWADIDDLAKLGYRPSTDIHSGISHFVAWYREYYKT